MAAQERRRSSKRASTPVPQDPVEAVLSDLHLAFTRGELRVLLGAGLSFSSGLPPWDTLNERLLLEHLRERYGGVDLVTDAQLAEAARNLYRRLGRDGSADLVRMLTPDGFKPLLARALYGARRNAEELVVRSVHLALAALARRMGGSHFLFTTNFDPLMELALSMPPAGGPAGAWRDHRVDGPRSRSLPQVAHLHGWVDPSGEASKMVVLTESDYLELAARGGHEINRQWDSLINGDGMLLVLGMSLNDPNLRRFLHERRRRSLRLRSRAQGVICAVFERADAHSDAYLRFYWERGWGIQKLDVATFDSIPSVLRAVRFGPGSDPARELTWLDAARSWVAERLTTEQIFSPGWQEFASHQLREMVGKLRTAFQLPEEERVNASFFLPVNERRGSALITRVATSRRPLATDEAGRADALGKRSLSVARSAPQGIAGSAFVEGLPVNAPFGSKRIDAGFSNEMVKVWNHEDRYRDWRSTYAVPVLDTPEWISVSVVTLTSSFSDPFWNRFPDALRDDFLTEMKRYCRKTANTLLRGTRGGA